MTFIKLVPSIAHMRVIRSFPVALYGIITTWRLGIKGAMQNV